MLKPQRPQVHSYPMSRRTTLAVCERNTYSGLLAGVCESGDPECRPYLDALYRMRQGLMDCEVCYETYQQLRFFAISTDDCWDPEHDTHGFVLIVALQVYRLHYSAGLAHLFLLP